VEMYAADAQSRQGHCISDQAQQDHQQTRHEEEPARAVEQEEAQCAPTVAKGLEVRLVRLAPIRMQRDRYLRDFFSIEAGLNDHFGGEFHPCSALIEAVLAVPGEAAKAA